MSNIRGLFAVAKRELFSNLKSIRVFILTILLSLGVIGGAYGLSVLSLKQNIPVQEEIKGILNRGPDAILYISSMFVAFIGSIAAVAISFDSITKEKLQNSLDLLLCRPVHKKAIGLGKFLGVLAALSLPVIVVLTISIICVKYATGSFPSLCMALGFIILTIILLGIFIAVQQSFSTLANTLGTAILLGIGVWMFFTLFWTLVPLSSAYILGVPVEINSAEYNILRSKIDLFSPIGAYDSCLGVLASGAGIAPNVPPWAPFLSLLLWLAISLFVFMWLFNKKIG